MNLKRLLREPKKTKKQKVEELIGCVESSKPGCSVQTFNVFTAGLGGGSIVLQLVGLFGKKVQNRVEFDGREMV
jgi:hypothetical protein